ncbi:ABC transporter permease subunit [Granulosicoccus sp. 3-233]|uniref:ABC transporter permease subunit n=1 Tax=Granulosicoccus sp. 3-233 TaxID=3417969 RepID=UPI003D34ABBA
MRTLAIAQDEILRLLSTRRGLLSLLGFALIWAGVLSYGILPAAAFFAGARESGLSEILLPRLGLSAWEQWPAPELAVYWAISLYLLPFMALLTSADQTASDRSRGTLRFLVLRCSRLEIFLGRFLGQCVIMALLILVTLGTVLLVIAGNSGEFMTASLARAPLIIINLILLVLPYIALMAWVSVMARSARQATLYAMVVWLSVSLLISYLQARFGPLALLDWILPGSQVGQLLRLADWQTLDYALIPVLHTIVLLLIGGTLMWRRDL